MAGNKSFFKLKNIYFLLPSNERKLQFWIILVFVIFGAIIETLSVSAILPILTAIADSNVAENFPFLSFFLDDFGVKSQIELIKLTLLFFIFLYCFKFFYMILLIYFQGRFIYGVQSEISQKLFRNYLKRNYIFHLNTNSAQLIRNATTEINSYNGAIGALLRLITESSIAAGIIIMLIFVEPVPAIITIIVLTLFNFSFYSLSNRYLFAWGKLRQEMDGKIYKYLQQGLNGIKESKVFNLHNFFFSNYRLPVIERAKVNVKQHVLQNFPRLLLELILVLGMSSLILSIIYQDQDPKKILPLIGLFSIAAFKLMPSSGKILEAAQKIQFNFPAVDILFADLNNIKSEFASDMSKNAIYQKQQKNISLRNISFSYSNTNESLINNLSIDFEINKTIGIVGKSGSGKSTLINIILGLINPNSGSLVFPKSLEGRSNKFGYVPQNIFLVDDTIKKNIALGVADEFIDNKRIKLAIEGAQLQDFIESLPEKIETEVGENGTRISGGQKQRIGIARALYRDPHILVFDESTSSLDKETENRIVQTIDKLSGTRTILIVSHNKEPLKNCDYIFDMNTGIISSNN